VSQRPDDRPLSPDRPAPHPGAVWLDAALPTVESHLALDEALLAEAHEGRCTTPVVRTWMADEHVIVLGSSCRVAEEIDLEACREAGVRVLRRPSGGGTVMLGPGCLMWSVIEHHAEAAPPIERIHAGMLEPLAGALTAVAPRPVVRRGLSDLAVVHDDGPRKISGNALRVRRHGVLYHGTLLDEFDLDLVSRLLRHPPREPDYRGRRPHADFLTNLGVGRTPLEEAVRAAFGATVRRAHWPAEAVEQLIRDRYADASWIRRL
jgi:lipoate-protein ligase A